MADSRYRRRGTRFRSRRRAVSLLFEAEMRDVNATELVRERQEMGAINNELGEVSSFSREIVEGVDEHRERIDATVGDHLEGWVLERLPAVDRAILRAGAWELLYGDADTDASTIIDQAVLLTAELSAEKSMGYINAVLDRVAGLADHIRAAEAAVRALDASTAQPTSVTEATSSDRATEDAEATASDTAETAEKQTATGGAGTDTTSED